MISSCLCLSLAPYVSLLQLAATSIGTQCHMLTKLLLTSSIVKCLKQQHLIFNQ